MSVLGIDCSGDLCSVAVATDDAVAERSVRQPGEQLKLLLPMTTGLLRELGLEARSLRRIAVSIGPGSFTGLRLALTTARTMGQVLGIGVVPIPTLDVIGWNLLESDPAAVRLCVLTDARKGQIFVAGYDVVDGRLARSGDYDVLDPDDAASWLKARAGEGSVAGGSAFVRYGEMLRAALDGGRAASPEAGLPWARHLARAARGDYGTFTEVGHAEVLPMYLRPPDVKKPKLPPPRFIPES